jgi:hypothetical protein
MLVSCSQTMLLLQAIIVPIIVVVLAALLAAFLVSKRQLKPPYLPLHRCLTQVSCHMTSTTWDEGMLHVSSDAGAEEAGG